MVPEKEKVPERTYLCTHCAVGKTDGFEKVLFEPSSVVYRGL